MMEPQGARWSVVRQPPLTHEQAGADVSSLPVHPQEATTIARSVVDTLLSAVESEENLVESVSLVNQRSFMGQQLQLFT